MKQKNNITAIVGYVIAALFFIYGIYMLIHSIRYAKLYENSYVDFNDSI